MRGKRDKFEILEIRPTKHFTAKLKQNYHFFGKETLGIVTSIVGEKPGERSVQFDVYEVKKDGYIVLKTNKGSLHFPIKGFQDNTGTQDGEIHTYQF